MADREIDLRRSGAHDHVFDGRLGAAEMLREKRLQVEDVESGAGGLAVRRRKRDSVDARRLPVGDEEDVVGPAARREIDLISLQMRSR
jgi:hypothetical protein